MKNARYFVIFSIIGALCIIIDYVIYRYLLLFGMIIFIAKVSSSVVSVSVNYILNSRFNFNNKQQMMANYYFQYLLLYVGLILLNATVNMIIIKITNNIKLSFWLAAVVAAFTNYLAVNAWFGKINRRSR